MRKIICRLFNALGITDTDEQEKLLAMSNMLHFTTMHAKSVKDISYMYALVQITNALKMKYINEQVFDMSISGALMKLG